MPQGLYEKSKDLPNFYEVYPTIYEDSQVIKVVANDDFSLSVWFKGNPEEKKCFDFKGLIEKYEYFKPLENLRLFMSARCQYGMVIWNNQLDILSEWLYLDSL